MKRMISEEEHQRRVAQIKIEDACRKANDAYCALHDVYRLMKEAGASQEGLDQVSRALNEASGFSPIEFMPDFPVSDRVGAYWDSYLVHTPYDNVNTLQMGVREFCKHARFLSVEIKPRKEGGFDTRWEFDSCHIDELRRAHE